MAVPAARARGILGRRVPAGGGGAPSIRAGDQISFSSSNSASDTFTAPTTIVNGDILVCLYGKDSAALVLDLPTGFSAMPGTTEYDDGGAVSRCGYKVALSESGNYPATSAIAERFTGWMGAVSGSSGIDVTNETFADPGDGTAEAGQVTTTVANCLVLYLIVTDDATGTISVASPPAGVTTVAQKSNNSGCFVYVGYEVKATAGLTTARVFNYGVAQEWICRTVALKP